MVCVWRSSGLDRAATGAAIATSTAAGPPAQGLNGLIQAALAAPDQQGQAAVALGETLTIVRNHVRRAPAGLAQLSAMQQETHKQARDPTCVYCWAGVLAKISFSKSPGSGRRFTYA